MRQARERGGGPAMQRWKGVAVMTGHIGCKDTETTRKTTALPSRSLALQQRTVNEISKTTHAPFKVTTPDHDLEWHPD